MVAALVGPVYVLSMSEAAHAIKLVSLRTGLTAHVIRVWEKRYNAVRPRRTATNRRLYSTDDIERLTLLHEATRAGHSISTIASLSTAELRKISSQTNKAAPELKA
ncbi:MAG: MerR family transcriptional regulator, partial [Limisphaerales bacterium]